MHLFGIQRLNLPPPFFTLVSIERKKCEIKIICTFECKNLSRLELCKVQKFSSLTRSCSHGSNLGPAQPGSARLSPRLKKKSM